jgi:hypothetical protein
VTGTGQAPEYILAFSGPTDAPPDHDYRTSLRAVEQYKGRPPRVVVSGCAYGVDTKATLEAIKLWPEVTVWCVVPAAYHNERFVEVMRERPGTKIIRAPERKNASDSYMARNDMMAEVSTDLAAFPDTSIEEQRSGTWATVRRFRKRRKPVFILPLSGFSNVITT